MRIGVSLEWAPDWSIGIFLPIAKTNCPHRERAVTRRIFQALPNFCPHGQTYGRTNTILALIYKIAPLFFHGQWNTNFILLASWAFHLRPSLCPLQMVLVGGIYLLVFYGFFHLYIRVDDAYHYLHRELHLYFHPQFFFQDMN